MHLNIHLFFTKLDARYACYIKQNPARSSLEFMKHPGYRYLMMREQFMVGKLRFGHILADSAVAGKTTGEVEHRFPAHH